MMEETYRSKLKDLVKCVNDLPLEQREQLQALVDETTRRHEDIAASARESEAALRRLDVTLQLESLANAAMLDAANRMSNSQGFGQP